MNIRNKVIMAITLVLATSAFAFDEAATLKTNMQAAMNQYMAAWKKKDAKAAEAVIRANFAKDFKATGAGGQTMNLEQWIAQDKMQMTQVKTVKSISMIVGKVTVKGATASSTDSFSADFVVNNPQSPKRTSDMHIESKGITTLKKVGGKWMVASMKESSTKMTMDGKSVGAGG